jgi:hypothetical protein
MDGRIDEIYRTIIEQSERQADHHAAQMREIGAILAEARKTNGRITRLETDVQSLQKWRWYVTGGFAVALASFDTIKDKISKLL